MASLAHGPKWSAVSAKERKHTRFETCDKHSGWFAGTTRERKAETFAEGGPGGLAGCEGGRCRIWPGRDFFVAEVCTSEMELDWTQAPAPVVRVVDIDTRLAEMQAQLAAEKIDCHGCGYSHYQPACD